jgi:hypothetical protein
MTNALSRLQHAAALLPALALGCAAEGGQTGEETPGSCSETRTALEPDEDSPLGFGAEEVLVTASADRAALEWLATEPAYGPESGTAELTLSLEALGTAAFVTSRTPDGRRAFPCEDRVEVDVAVTLATSGGALAESFEATLRAEDANEASLWHAFQNGDVEGTLSFDEDALAGRTLERVTLDARFYGGELSGSLSAGIEHRAGSASDGTASFQEITIACFGAATDRCPPR